jgi:hypothetical protein
MPGKLSRIKKTALEILAAASLVGIGQCPNTSSKMAKPIPLANFFNSGGHNVLSGLGGSGLNIAPMVEHVGEETLKELLLQLLQHPILKLIDAAINYRLDQAGAVTEQEKMEKKMQLLQEIQKNPDLLKKLIDEYARSSPEARKLTLEAERYEAEQARKDNPLQL